MTIKSDISIATGLVRRENFQLNGQLIFGSFVTWMEVNYGTRGSGWVSVSDVSERLESRFNIPEDSTSRSLACLALMSGSAIAVTNEGARKTAMKMLCILTAVRLVSNYNSQDNRIDVFYVKTPGKVLFMSRHL